MLRGKNNTISFLAFHVTSVGESPGSDLGSSYGKWPEVRSICPASQMSKIKHIYGAYLAGYISSFIPRSIGLCSVKSGIHRKSTLALRELTYNLLSSSLPLSVKVISPGNSKGLCFIVMDSTWQTSVHPLLDSGLNPILLFLQVLHRRLHS